MNKKKTHPVREQARLLPRLPGIYRFYDKDGKIIYIGKAKDLRKRVMSYFSKAPTGKHALLMQRMHRLDHIVTENETEAFLLENIQIKHHKPRYNILLKDDKTYPWIVIRHEAFPRVELTRRWEKGAGEYFGPYPSVYMARTLLELIHDLFPLRTCKLDLRPEKIDRGQYQVCLEYHLGRCKAPCTGGQTEEDYGENIKRIREILKGNFRPAMAYLEQQMLGHANRLAFEKAQWFKDKMDALTHYQARSTVVNPKLGNVAVFSLIADPQRAYVNFMEVANGSIIRAKNMEIRRKWNETDEEILAAAIGDIYTQFSRTVKEIIVPFRVEIPLKTRQTVPRRGDKKKLLDLSEKNARYFRLERRKQLQIKNPEEHKRRLLEQVKTDLRLNKLPFKMECFDISHTQGTEKTASCVVFHQLKPAKKEYRHFKIKTVEGIDDYAAMREVVYRRYKRLLDEGKDLPELVVIDGGKGQLNAAMESLRKLGIENQVQLIGIAKRLEEIYRPGDPLPLYLDKRSETLKIIQQIRNEAHRFGLRLHRKRRDRKSVQTRLTSLPGIGEKTAVKLLRHFGSMPRIEQASVEELAKVLGPKRARVFYERLHPSAGSSGGD